MQLNSEFAVAALVRRCSAAVVAFAAVLFIPSAASASTQGLPTPGDTMTYGFIDGVLQWVADVMRDAAFMLFEMVMNFLQNAPEPDVSGPDAWILDQYTISLDIGLWLVVPFIAAATIQAFFKGGINEVLKLYLLGVPVAIIGAAIGLAFVNFLILIVEDICQLFYARMTENFNAHMEALRAQSFDPETNGILMQIVFFLAMLIGLLVLFMELIVRNVAIYMAVLFLPMAFAAWVWEPTRTWLSRIVQAIALLIMAKFIIVAVLSFSFSVVSFTTDASNNLQGVQMIGLMALTIATLFVGTVAAPLIISFVLRPDFDADVSSFKGMRQESVFNADMWQVNQAYRGYTKSAYQYVRNGKQPKGG